MGSYRIKKHLIREKEGLWATDRGCGEIVIYREKRGDTGLEVRLEGETQWLSQGQIVDSYGRNQSVIARHIRNVFIDGKLIPSKSNMQKMHNAFLGV